LRVPEVAHWVTLLVEHWSHNLEDASVVVVVTEVEGPQQSGVSSDDVVGVRQQRELDPPGTVHPVGKTPGDGELH